MTDEPTQPKEGPKQPVDNGLSLRQAFGLAWEMGYTMAIPLVILALAGQLVDKHYQTSPLFLLIGIIISIIVSSILVGMKAVAIISRFSDKNS
jgi:F0F1-type ATP synthase assembly protein I